MITNKYLTVFDYHTGQVYQTDLTDHFTYEDFEKGIDIEEFLEECEFYTGNCHWMTGEYEHIEKF